MKFQAGFCISCHCYKKWPPPHEVHAHSLHRFFFWLCHGGYTGRTTGLTEFTLFEIVYVILLIIHKRQPNQRRQRCLPHFVRQEREIKEVLHSLAPALTLTLIPITHSLNHLANKLLRTTSTSYDLNRRSALRIMNI